MGYAEKRKILERKIKNIIKELDYTDEKRKSILDAYGLYLDGNEICEIAAKLGKVSNTVKGYLSDVNKYLQDYDIEMTEKIHIKYRFNNKDNLYVFVKDCYEKGLPVSDIADKLGGFFNETRVLYQQLENTESKKIRDNCLKLKGIPSNFEDIAFFYIMGRNKLSFVKMFSISASEMNKVRKYLDSQNEYVLIFGKGALDDTYEHVESLSSTPIYKDWLKVMELYHMGDTLEQINEKTKITIPEIKKYIKLYEDNRVYEAQARANVILKNLYEMNCKRLRKACD